MSSDHIEMTKTYTGESEIVFEELRGCANNPVSFPVHLAEILGESQVRAKREGRLTGSASGSSPLSMYLERL
jgi:hypothetical protein